MNLLSMENLTKSYGEKVLFDKITFGIDEGDKIGLIGVNGTGKSTFLKIIAGLERAEAGNITTGSSVRIEYLPQNPAFAPGATVLEQIFKGHSPVMKVLREYEECLAKVQLDSHNELWQKKLITLSEKMDACNGWQLESDAKTILTKLGVTDYQADISTLSGGQRKRIALAGALINPTDLLILDEPTNHIDNQIIAWLEQYLAKGKGALLMVTHDRYFLDRVTNRIVELSGGKLYSYLGNYSKFLEIKAQREEQAEASERKRQSILRKELAWIQRGAKARTTKQKARIERFEELSAAKPQGSEEKMEIAFGASRLGKKVIELKDIKKSFSQQALIDQFSYTVLKDDRVGIVGPNGSGKSTLLKLIMGELAPDSGTVEIGQTVKIGYFSQENQELPAEIRVIDYIKEGGNYLPTLEGGTISASQMLERFLFPPNAQWAPIAKLSGGEKRRLSLLRILMEAPNVLILDEPTNDLDIQTLTILEDYLDDFQGAVILVSHDRYLLERITEKIFGFLGHGVIKQYLGGYLEYQEDLREREKEASLTNDTNNVKGKSSGIMEKAKEKPPKFTYNEQREYEQIENIIACAEEELEETKARIEAAGSDYQLLQELLQAQAEQELKLEGLYERWAYLNELAEEIKSQRSLSPRP